MRDRSDTLWKAAGGVFLLGAGLMAWREIRRSRTRFRDSVVLITGGSRGLGLSIARQLSREGAKVILCGRDPETLERAGRDVAESGNEVLILPCDVSRSDEVRELIGTIERHYGRLDVLINNASIIQVSPFEAQSDVDFRRVVEINFWGVYHCTREALPLMARTEPLPGRPSRRIVNITSIGAEVSVPHLLSYNCAKAAARAFSEGIGSELRKAGFRVTTVLPGLMRTGSFLHALFKGQSEKEFRWFSMAATAPLVTIQADRAARMVIEAARLGDPFVTLGLPARILRGLHANLPGTTVRALGVVNRLLPRSAPEGEEVPQPGYWLLPGLRFARPSLEDAARRNQLG